MGLLGKLFPRRHRGEEKLTQAPVIQPGKPKSPRKSGQMTRTQRVNRRKAMVGRKVNRKRLIKEAS